MVRSVRWGLLLLLALVTAGWLGAESTALLAAEASQRADTWEFSLPVRYVNGQTIDATHGSSIDINSDLGWGFGFGYNMSEKVELTFAFAWMNANYKVKWASATDPGTFSTGSGSMDVGSTNIGVNYNFMPKTITPYVSGTIAWNWVDTNIPTAPPQTGCWWDPWYGYICTTYQNTANFSGFSYGLGLGVRIEPKESFYFKIGLDDMWQDWGGDLKVDPILSYRAEMGWKF